MLAFNRRSAFMTGAAAIAAFLLPQPREADDADLDAAPAQSATDVSNAAGARGRGTTAAIEPQSADSIG